MKKVNHWLPRPGVDANGFVEAFEITVKRNPVPVVFHMRGFSPATDIVHRDNAELDLSETTHIGVEIVMTNRFLDPRIPIDENTGLPFNKELREEYVALCNAMREAGGMAEDPRIAPTIDMVRAVGKRALPLDPLTGAKSNTLFLHSTGDVKIKLAYKDGGPYPDRGIFHVVRYYPDYETRINRLIKRAREPVRVLASYMFNPKASGFVDINKREL